MLRLVWPLLFVAIIPLFSGCSEDEEQANLVKAQACLDTATASNALSCVNDISSMNDVRAYVLVCAARFIAKDFDEARIATALTKIKDDNDSNPTSQAIANLAVLNDARTGFDVPYAQATLDDSCALTESEGLIALATFSLISTAVANSVTANACINVISDPNNEEFPYSIDEACMQTEISGGGTTDAATIGKVASENEEFLCGEDGIVKDEPICLDIQNSTGDGKSDAQIGQDILTAIQGD